MISSFVARSLIGAHAQRASSAIVATAAIGPLGTTSATQSPGPTLPRASAATRLVSDVTKSRNCACVSDGTGAVASAASPDKIAGDDDATSSAGRS